MTRKVVLVVLVMAILTGALFAQEVSEKKDLAVFALSYYDWKIPSNALGLVDSQIKDVFINLGRFNILGMNYQLSSNDIDDFIQRIKAFKEENVEISEEVQLGQEAFTEADFNRLVNSFIVVIPVLSYYNLSVNDDGYSTVDITTSFTIINIETLETIAYFNVETDGFNEDSQVALKRATDEIALQLQYEIRKIPVFQIKSGIVDILRAGEVVIQFGRDMGLKAGDEYEVVLSEELNSGYVREKRKALMVIKNVEQDHSVAHVVYSRGGKPVIGEQVKEIPKLGLDTTVYAHALFDVTNFSNINFNAGFRQSLSRGFFIARPLVGAEVPIMQLLNTPGGLPINFFGGGELNLWFGRFQLVPMVAGGLGIAFAVDGSDDTSISHAGGFAQVNLNYLIHDIVRLSAEAGFAYWFGINGASSYNGIILGAAVQIKY